MKKIIGIIIATILIAMNTRWVMADDTKSINYCKENYLLALNTPTYYNECDSVKLANYVITTKSSATDSFSTAQVKGCAYKASNYDIEVTNLGDTNIIDSLINNKKNNNSIYSTNPDLPRTGTIDVAEVVIVVLFIFTFVLLY